MTEKQLKFKRMGGPKPLVGLLVLAVSALALSGCIFPEEEKEDTVFLTKVGGAEMVKGLGGTMDAFVGWEPFPAEAVIKGGKVLLKSSEIWEHHPCCVMAYRNKWFENTEDAQDIVTRMVWAHKQATDWINEAKDVNHKNHTKLVEYAVDFTQRNEEIVELALDNVDFDYAIGIDGIKEYGNVIYDKAEIMVEEKWDDSGYSSMDEYIDDVIDSSYIDSGFDPNVNLTEKKVRVGYISSDLHHLALWIIIGEGIGAKVNLDIETEHRSNGVYVMKELFRTGVVDMAYLGIAPAVIHGINSNDFTFNDARIEIVAGVNYNGSAIIVEKGIESIEDLAGKTVGYPGTGTVQWYLLLKALEEKNMKIAI